MNNIYIALDLETTGFDPKLDQVIEIAAIKFQGDTILERFETLVNPQIEIPSMVSHITGITNDDLAESPLFDEIKTDLIKFLGNYPIIGHNISFDVTFLIQKGLPLTNPLYDTIHLASILLPGLPSYSLDTITRVLKIKHENKHRAASDAEASLKLFNLLEKKISAIPENILTEIRTLIAKSNWHLGNIFNEMKRNSNSEEKNGNISENSINHIENNFQNIVQTEIENPAMNINSIEELLDLFQPFSPLAKLIPHYEIRPSQQRMSQKIVEAFSENKHLLIEAGTGTGKTFAYLLAAAFWSKTLQEKIVISTFTNTLQDQILKKDFPLINKLFPYLKTAVLKGRKKYLSLHRFNKLKAKPFLDEHEIVVIIKVLLWLDQHVKQNQQDNEFGDCSLFPHCSGDLEELSLQNKEFTVLDEICCDQYHCHEVESKSQDGCFLLKARRQADQANIIIVNHALLLQNAISETPILPQSHYLIVDEAHHLEKVATDALTIHLSSNQFQKIFERIENQLFLVKNFKQSLFDGILESSHSIIDQEKTISDLMLSSYEIKNKIDVFFNILENLVEDYGKQNSFQQLQLNLTKYITEEQNWQKALDNYKDIMAKADTFFGKSFGVTIKIQEQEILKNDVLKLSEALHDLQKKLKELGEILGDFDHKISWIHRSPEESLSLKSAPLSVSLTLDQHLFSNKKSVILTSATLTTNHSFQYIRSELGLGEHFEELSLPSHFSYPDQVKIIIPEDLDNPNGENYGKECSEIIANVVRKNGGRTLCLFTSKKALGNTFYEIAPPLKKEGFSILAQGISGGRGKIISHFKDEPGQSAILGTNSFWEGVDILGDDLTCVIIQKLPFDPPDDPIMYARGQRYKNVFEDYQLPRAILRFKQGFGRLIRSASDTGSIIILDNRLIQKKYGQQFIESLPQGIQIEYCSKKKIADYL